MHVVILFNAPTLPASHPDYASEAGVLESVTAMQSALMTAGHRVQQVECGQSAPLLANKLAAAAPDVVLNLCESFSGKPRGEPQVAALLELLGIPFTGCSSECLYITRDKRRTKLLLKGGGLPTADFIYIPANQRLAEVERIEQMLADGPLLVKPAAEDASLGIGPDSVVTNLQSLVGKVESLGAQYGDVLLERYIDGREFNVGVLSLPNPHTLPIGEILFRTSESVPWPIVTYDSKWAERSADYEATPVKCPAEVEPQLAREIQTIALKAFTLCGCRDYARVDLRVTARGELFILEVNANPDAGPSAGFATALRAAGTNYEQFVCSLVQNAAGRNRDRPSQASTPANHARKSQVNLRPYRAIDREQLLQILRDCEMFREDEVIVAAEILDEAAQAGPDGHYKLVVAELGGRAVGWSCHGLVPMTDATYDLYWIAVDPKLQSQGIGRLLLTEIEHQVSASGGRWLIAETSSTPVYDGTRRFYLRAGFSIVGDMPDFYRTGDGRLTFARRLGVNR